MHNKIEVNGMRVERFPELRGRGGYCVVTDLVTGETVPNGQISEALRQIARHLGMSPDGKLFDGRHDELITHRYADAVIDRFFNLGDEWWVAGPASKTPTRKPRRGIVGGRRR